MDIRDSQRIKEIRDNTAKMADAFTRIADALERLADRKTEPSFKVDEIGDDDPTIHAIAYLQKVGWLQEHDRALTEQTEQNSSEKPNNCDEQTEVDWKQRLCDMYGADRKSFDEAWEKYEADKVEDEPQTDCAWK